MSFHDHFSAKAPAYAQARPTYPVALFDHLARLTPGRALAWDAGTGSGQAAVALASHFQRVIATDPSAAQLAAAAPHARVIYGPGAETVPSIRRGTADLATAAQAAHWFDREAYFAEVRRVLRPGGIVALWTYALCAITPEIDVLVLKFYSQTVGPFWPPERRHTENGYRDFDFPFAELPFPAVAMTHEWTAAEFLAYLRTWSAVTRYQRERSEDPVLGLETALIAAWGDGRRKVTWPLSGRIGRMPFL